MNMLLVTEPVQQMVSEMTAATQSNYGWSEMLSITLISICLVFVVLILLVFVMKLFGVIFARPKSTAVATTAASVEASQIHEEEIAAILVAISLFKTEMHDRESEVLTIQSIKRAYSPWNSKIHGLTHMPDKK